MEADTQYGSSLRVGARASPGSSSCSGAGIGSSSRAGARVGARAVFSSRARSRADAGAGSSFGADEF